MRNPATLFKVGITLCFFASVVTLASQAQSYGSHGSRSDLLLRKPITGLTVLNGYSTAFEHTKLEASSAFFSDATAKIEKEEKVEKQYPNGGSELWIATAGMNFWNRTVPGIRAEYAYRWPGSTEQKDGHFSIGVQAAYWPTLGRWSSVPYDIARVTTFRPTILGDPPYVRFGSVEVEPNELFLVPREGSDLSVGGSFLPNPGTQTIFEFITYRVTNMRTSMVGFDVPMRWYWGEQRVAKPRYFIDGGVGLDVLLVKADYNVITRGVRYNESTSEITFVRTEVNEDEPMGGEIGKNILFSHVNFGAGVAYGKFSLSAQGKFLFSSVITVGPDRYDRIRGNVLAIPALAGAADDPALLEKLNSAGAIMYGAIGISKGNEHSTVNQGSGLANGIKRFSDRTQWLLSLAYRLH